jgi:hypothetical protein
LQNWRFAWLMQIKISLALRAWALAKPMRLAIYL